MHGSGCSRLLISLLVAFLAPLTFGPLAHGQADTNPLLSPSANPGLPDQRLPDPDQRIPYQPIPFPRPFPAPRNPIGFPQLARAAGTIFSGTVAAVTRRPAVHGETIETVSVTFHVEQAIRGTTPGENLTVRQWMGLWSSGQHYRVGERLMVFLYPPSKLGLTSLVGGGLGRFVVDPYGRVLLNAQHMNAFQKDAVLGGKSRVRVSDFALAVNRAGEEESEP
jgi:hypothetical protein